MQSDPIAAAIEEIAVELGRLERLRAAFEMAGNAKVAANLADIHRRLLDAGRRIHRANHGR